MEEKSRDNKPYGKELILDLHNCDPSTYRHREDIEEYVTELCKKINVKPCKLNWWDYAGYPSDYEEAPPHLKGTSAVQFIMTSTIIIHSLDELGKVYVDIFSCDDFDCDAATKFTEEWFKGKIAQKHVIKRL